MPCDQLCSIIFFLIYKRILISCISQLLHNKTFLCLSSDLNDIMDIAALTAVVAYDSYFDAQRIQSDYSPALIPTVTQHYDEIHTTYICDELLTSNFVRFRFALNRPIATLDYAPIIIGHHNWLMNFLEALFTIYFINASFFVNFSPALILSAIDGNSPINNFLYSSTNFLCLPDSILVHSAQTLRQALQAIRQFNLSQYLENSERELSRKYEGCNITPVSIVFHLTRMPDILFGHRLKKLSNQQHEQQQQPQLRPHQQQPQREKWQSILHGQNMCVFDCLSTRFRVKTGQVIKKASQRVDKKTARQLKHVFLKWVKEVKLLNVTTIFCPNGLNFSGLMLCQEYFGTNFLIWEYKHIFYKKIVKNGLSKSIRPTKLLKLVWSNSSNLHSENVHCLQTNTDKNSLLKHLRPITNIRKIGKKHFCTCNAGFSSSWRLKNHQQNCGKTRFFFDKAIYPSKTIENQIREFTQGQSLQLDNAYIFMQFEKLNNVYCCHLSSTSDSYSGVSFISSCLDSLCENALSWANKISQTTKVSRLQNNLTVLAALSILQASSPQFDELISKVKDYLCHVAVFVLLKQSDDILGSKLLRNFMKIFLQQNPLSSLKFNTRRGHVSSVTMTGPNSGLKLILINELIHNYFASDSETFMQRMTRFGDMCIKILHNTRVDIRTGFVHSTTHLAHLFFSQHVITGTYFVMVSPPKDLYSFLIKECRYGVLAAEKKVSHPDLDYKCYFELDFSKHFLHILKDTQFFMGSPIELKKEGVVFVCKRKTLRHHTFANILFCTISKWIKGHLQYNLVGKEALIEGYPVDALVTCESPNTSHGKRTIGIQFHGCYFHACPRECHQDIISETHLRSCMTCKATKTVCNSKYRPRLWKLPKQQTFQSNHPSKKIPYSSVQENTKRIDNILKNSSKLFRFMSFYECQIVHMWDKPLYQFILFLGLIPLSTLPLFITLGQCFVASVEESFPLLKAKKITMQSIVQNSRANTLHGLVRVKGTVGKKGLELLKNFQIFSHLSQAGKMINSNTLDYNMISTGMLNFLLDNTKSYSLQDFVLKDISHIFLWPNISLRPYSRACDHILKAMSANEHDATYISILKQLANVHIGNFARCPNKNPDTHLLKSPDFHDLSQYKNLRCTENITSDVILATFHSNRSHYNAIHNNFLILQQSRIIFIKMLLSLTSFLNLDFASCNCDGLLTMCKQRLRKNVFGVLALDSALKPISDRSQLNDYLALKCQYFKNPLVCPLHREIYIDCLFTNKPFIPDVCCINYVSDNDYPHKLKVQTFGDKAIVFGVNKVVMIDIVTGKPIIKYSGLKDRQIETVFSKNAKELRSLFNP